MRNTTRGINSEITESISKSHVRIFNHKALPPEKQKEFTRQARVMLDRISALENNTEAAIKML